MQNLTHFCVLYPEQISIHPDHPCVVYRPWYPRISFFGNSLPDILLKWQTPLIMTKYKRLSKMCNFSKIRNFFKNWKTRGPTNQPTDRSYLLKLQGQSLKMSNRRTFQFQMSKELFRKNWCASFSRFEKLSFSLKRSSQFIWSLWFACFPYLYSFCLFCHIKWQQQQFSVQL